MTRNLKTSIAFASCCGAAAVWMQVAAAQAADPTKPKATTAKTLTTVTTGAAGAAGSTGKSLSDSPYEKGAPPITGGYTDTSQGGTKTSGDPLAAPPGAVKAPPKAAE